jgi:hypothetical protein
MALVLADRVNETTTTTGSGTVTLLGAVSGYRTFSVVGDGNQTYYVIAHQSLDEWEVGIGTYTSATVSLSRDEVLSSTAGGALVNFSAGTKRVFVDYPAGKAVYEDVDGNVDVVGNVTAGNGIFVNASTMSISFTIDSGFNGFTVGPFTIASGVSLTISAGQRHVII